MHCVLKELFGLVALADAYDLTTAATAMLMWQQQMLQLKAPLSIARNDLLLHVPHVLELRLLRVPHAEPSPKCIHISNRRPQAICCGPHSLARAAGAFGSAGQSLLSQSL